jgi:enoyl-CoA hydratase/carnithine racemase
MEISKILLPNQQFDDYCERFKDVFSIRRESGIIEVRMRNDGGPAQWKKEHRDGWGSLLKAIGSDFENEVLIIGGAGENRTASGRNRYLARMQKLQKNDPAAYAKEKFTEMERTAEMIYAMVFDVDIPVIGVLDGFFDKHMALALMSDVTLCAPDVTFRSTQFRQGMVPGDGFFLMMQQTLGLTRANYLAYTGKGFGAEEALRWGVINELVPTEEIYNRAWELARSILEKPRPVRCLTRDLSRKPLREYICSEYEYHTLAECLAGVLSAG